MFGDDTWVSLFPDMYVLPSDQGVSPFTCSFSPFPSFLPFLLSSLGLHFINRMHERLARLNPALCFN